MAVLSSRLIVALARQVTVGVEFGEHPVDFGDLTLLAARSGAAFIFLI